MATKRELIVRNIVSALQQIRTSNGYDTELGTNVQRYLHEDQALASAPVAIVSCQGEQYDNREIQGMAKGSLGLAIVVICDAPSSSWTQGAEAWADTYLRDVQRAVMVDPSRDGKAIDTLFGSWDFLGEDPREFGFVLYLGVSYYHSHEDPSS
jgi:hypothetical protein